MFDQRTYDFHGLSAVFALLDLIALDLSHRDRPSAKPLPNGRVLVIGFLLG